MPKVSVVILTYNRLQLLKVAISSVLNQTFQDYEIIVVDDGSTDNTDKVIATFNDERIRYICHKRNRGEADARNTGIKSAKGEYIAFLDDDDEWLPEKLDLQIQAIENSPQCTGLIYTGCIYTTYGKNKRNKERLMVPFNRGNIYHILMKKNFITTPSIVLIKRECMEKIGLFDSKIAYGLDYDYWIRISQYFEFDYIAEPLVKYRLHDDRMSNDIELMFQGSEDLARKYGRSINLTDAYWQGIYIKNGIKKCNNGEMKEGVRSLIKYIRCNPSDIKAYVYFLSALLGPRNFRKLIIIKDKLRRYSESRQNGVKITGK